MGSISLQDVHVQFAIYGLGNRSLKKSLISAATGGALATDARNHVVVKALDGVSLEAREGERIGLCGHNGSGKTTLLRVLAGAYEPMAGVVDVRGSVVSMLSIALGMDPDATGLENVFLRGAVMGVQRRQIERMLEGIMEFAELGDYLYMPLRTYSSGMQMRLAFAISTAAQSDVILMDEWLSVGDAEFASKANERLRSLVNNAKIVVIASHDMTLLQQNCTRLVRLDHGRIIEDRRLSR
jgi:lipopolysaccharide transport system ATP-binding protein